MPNKRHLSLAYLDRKVGPFLDTQGVQAIAALSAEELALAEQFHDILFIAISGGPGGAPSAENLYPAFQFGIRGELLPGLREVADILRPATAASPWYLALWLRTRCDSFQGRTPEDILRAGLVGPVLDLAREEMAGRAEGQSEVQRNEH